MLHKNLKNARILIIDDRASNIEILSSMLDLAGYKNVEYTTDSRKAMSLIKKFDPDLILLDLMMPHLSGFEIMELIKKDIQLSLDPQKYLPILVLTADVSPETRIKALEAGAKDFLSKPFDLFELKLRIRNLLETQYLFQLLKERNKTLEEKIIDFLKLNNDWYN